MNRTAALVTLATFVAPAFACDDPDPAESFRTCTPDWQVVEEAKVPCHMDVDKHVLHRQVEAYGVDVLMDAKGCVPGKTYEKVELASMYCMWSISAWDCAQGLYMNMMNGTPMPQSVYDKDACPGSGGGGVGGGGGGSTSPK